MSIENYKKVEDFNNYPLIHYLNYGLFFAYESKIIEAFFHEPMTVGECAKTVNIPERTAEPLVLLLVHLGYLKVVNDNESFTKYGISDTGSLLFKPDGPYCVGDQIFCDLTMGMASYDDFKNLILRSHVDSDVFSETSVSSEKAEIFNKAMHSHSYVLSRIWPTKIEPLEDGVFLDIGSGTGTHSAAAAEFFPKLKFLLFDLSKPNYHAAKFWKSKKEDLACKMNFVDGDMWTTPFPVANFHFYSNVFHDYTLKECDILAEKSYSSLGSGSRIIVLELPLDRKKPSLIPCLYSLSMLEWTKGKQHSESDIVGILEKSGFCDIKIIDLDFSGYKIFIGNKL